MQLVLIVTSSKLRFELNIWKFVWFKYIDLIHMNKMVSSRQPERGEEKAIDSMDKSSMKRTSNQAVLVDKHSNIVSRYINNSNVIYKMGIMAYLLYRLYAGRTYTRMHGAIYSKLIFKRLTDQLREAAMVIIWREFTHCQSTISAAKKSGMGDIEKFRMSLRSQ